MTDRIYDPWYAPAMKGYLSEGFWREKPLRGSRRDNRKPRCDILLNFVLI